MKFKDAIKDEINKIDETEEIAKKHLRELEFDFLEDGNSASYVHRFINNIVEKNDKLKKLILLTDPVVENIEVGPTQLAQWTEYCKCFPDEGEI